MTDTPTTRLNDWNRTESIAIAMSGLTGALELAAGLVGGFTYRTVTLLLACGALVFMTALARNYRILYERRRALRVRADAE